MTIRRKVLLVAGLTMGLLVLMGLTLHEAVRVGRLSRDRLLLIQEQIDSFGRLHVASEQYLRSLLRARDTGGDTQAILREFQATIDREHALLRDLTRQEHSADARVEGPEEWAVTMGSLRDWALRAEATVRTQPTEARQPIAEWKLFEEFEHDAGKLITSAQQEEYREKALLKKESEGALLRGARLAFLLPTVSGVLLLMMIASVIVPLGRALRELLGAARRISQGDFQVGLSTDRRDELGALARTLDQMAQALKRTLEEKQRMIRAEARAKEKAALRQQALLEETVRERTAELEQANVQLMESLRKLKDTQAQLFFADRLASIGQLAAGVGHEINNPLAYVISNLNYLQKEVTSHQEALPEDIRGEVLEVLAETRDGAERVRLIVRDLKELARPTEESTGPVNLHEVVSAAAKLISRELSPQTRLVEDCANVPPVRGSTTRLGQVFLNLLINATQAIAKLGELGNREHEIRVVARESAPDRVTVEVSDTGCGIAPEHLGRIFDPFYTTKQTGEGTGLGLSVCHSIITSLGGVLHVSSELGRGTTFSVELPIARPGAVEVTRPVKSPALVAPPPLPRTLFRPPSVSVPTVGQDRPAAPATGTKPREE